MAEVALVTGGAGGMGAAICEALAQDGLSVVVADFRKSEADRLAEKLAAAGGQALSVGVDVGDKDSVKEMMERAVKAFGRLDHQINTAGVMGRVSVKEMPEEEWDRVIRVNLRGVFLCCQAAAEVMRSKNGGRMINVASGRGIAGAPNAAHYSASKAGVIGFTRSLASELAAENIVVNAICPGRTETPMAKAGYTETQWQKIKAVPPLEGGLTEMDEITGLVRYLLSGAARYITGQLFLLRTP